jgi:hypothetical protein
MREKTGQLMHAVLKDTEGNWRDLNGSMTGKLLRKLSKIMKSLSQADLFVA